MNSVVGWEAFMSNQSILKPQIHEHIGMNFNNNL